MTRAAPSLSLSAWRSDESASVPRLLRPHSPSCSLSQSSSSRNSASASPLGAGAGAPPAGRAGCWGGSNSCQQQAWEASKGDGRAVNKDPPVCADVAALRIRSRRAQRSARSSAACRFAAPRPCSRIHSGSARIVQSARAVRAGYTPRLGAGRSRHAPSSAGGGTLVSGGGSAAAAIASSSHVSVAHNRLSVLPWRAHQTAAEGGHRQCLPFPLETQRRPRRHTPACGRCDASTPAGCGRAGRETRRTWCLAKASDGAQRHAAQAHTSGRPGNHLLAGRPFRTHGSRSGVIRHASKCVGRGGHAK